MELKSLKKKYKANGFAAGCSREIIARGAYQLGWQLDDLLKKDTSGYGCDRGLRQGGDGGRIPGRGITADGVLRKIGRNRKEAKIYG